MTVVNRCDIAMLDHKQISVTQTSPYLALLSSTLVTAGNTMSTSVTERLIAFDPNLKIKLELHIFVSIKLGRRSITY